MAILKNTIIDSDGFLQLPVGTTAQRPAPANGQIRFNTTTGKAEFYNATAAEWLGTPSAGVVATGGDVIYDIDIEGTKYRVHIFTTTGMSSFQVKRGGEIEYLIVAGGGGGGFDFGGGGGGGGLLTGTTTVTPQGYTITVGAGGSGAAATSSDSGGNSTAFGLTAIGGGGGANGSGARSYGPPKVGGSGGGGGGWAQNLLEGAAGTSGQGFAGGTARFADNTSLPGGGGGGGGAGNPGLNSPSETAAGGGGAGLAISMSGVSTFYAGGGGGGSYDTGTPGIGGLGGGGSGSTGINTNASSGTPNTGGGGGANSGGGGGSGGSGGSGIVVIRYPLRQENPVTAANSRIGNVIGDSLVLDLDFAKPTVYSGSGTAVSDSRINGITGTLVNGPVFTNPRTHSSGFSFDGVDDHIQLNSGFANFSSGITIAAYVSFNNVGGWERIIDFGNSSANNNILFARQATTNDLRFEIYNGTVLGFGITATNGILNNTMAHYVATVNGSVFSLYRNGVSLTSSSSTIVPQNVVRTLNYIGRSNWPDAFFNGDIKLVKIYNRGLSATEVVQEFDATRWRFGV